MSENLKEDKMITRAFRAQTIYINQIFLTQGVHVDLSMMSLTLLDSYDISFELHDA